MGGSFASVRRCANLSSMKETFPLAFRIDTLYNNMDDLERGGAYESLAAF